MKAILKKDLTSAQKTLRDLEKLMASAPILGKVTPLYPKLSEKIISGAIREVLLADKPYDMEDADWLLKKEQEFRGS